MKFTISDIQNPKTGKWYPIVAKSVLPCKARDALIGGALVLAGIAYLTVTSFRHGAYAFEQGEYNALEEAGLFVDSCREG